MDRQEFQDSWKGKKGQPMSMLVASIRLECTCNKIFFTSMATTELEGDFAKRCPLCKRTHRFNWFIKTLTDEDIDDEE